MKTRVPRTTVPLGRRRAWLQRRCREALGLAARGRAGRAVAVLDAVTRREPDCAWALFFRAGLRVCRGDSDGAAADLAALEGSPPEWLIVCHELELPPPPYRRRLAAGTQRLLRRHPRLAWARALAAFHWRERENWPAMNRELDAALRLSPGGAGLWALAARFKANFGVPSAAAEAMERAHRLAPGCPWICAWYGEVLRHRGELRGALRHLDAAIGGDPQIYVPYAWRGGVRRSLGLRRGARADLEVALTRGYARDASHSAAWARHQRSLLRRAAGDFPGAARDLRAAHGINPRFGWLEAGPGAGALAELERAIARHPGSSWARAWRGHALLEMGRPAESLPDFIAALRLAPRSAWPMAWAGSALARLGRPRGALRLLNDAVRLDPSYAPAFLERGMLRLRRRAWAAAERDLREATRLYPQYCRAWEERAAAARGLGRPARAAEYLARARQLDPRGGRRDRA